MSGTAMPNLPSSLALHICVLPSDDLTELLENSNLPPLHQILQTFSPLSQVSTRTSTLASITHESFPVRFSDLSTIENACKEDQETRASRMIDLLSSRVVENATTWVRDLESHPISGTTPWWQDIRDCVEGDWVPISSEIWNHPVAVLLAVSTHGPNPLQAVEKLHSRSIQFPSWVEPNILRYTLILHSDNSPLSLEESIALFNAVKKQFGQYTYLLTLDLSSSHSPHSTALIPDARYRFAGLLDSALGLASTPADSQKISQKDFTEINKFVRELVVSSLIPIMERSVLDWSETYPSSRRLPSRLFSSTRRLFGTSATPVTPPSKSVHQKQVNSVAAGGTSGAEGASHRRLAQFATLLGDLKLAISVWENLRKEGLGGSEILPLLLAPSPTLLTYASHALQALNPTEASASAQMLSLRYVIRWELGVQNFLSKEVQGETWLAWAAGWSDEVTSALILGQAAHLREQDESRPSKRAAMWYVTAADRLEQSGIKPIRMYLLRRAREIYLSDKFSGLSPAFQDAEFFGKNQEPALSDIITHVEHSLGRIHYTMGETETAVELLLSLFRQKSHLAIENSLLDEKTQLHLEDFRSVFEHMLSTVSPSVDPKISLPLHFCAPSKTRIQGEEDNFVLYGYDWTEHHASWERFRRNTGLNAIDWSVKAQTGERLSVEITLRNTLSLDVLLSNLTLQVDSKHSSNVEISVISSITLAAMSDLIISFTITVHVPMVVQLQALTYSFLDLVRCSESLAIGGRRLNENPAQMRDVIHAPPSFPQVDVENERARLAVELREFDATSLFSGEFLNVPVTFRNVGRETIESVWLLQEGSCNPWSTFCPVSGQIFNPTSREDKFEMQNELVSSAPALVALRDAPNQSNLQPGDLLTLPLIVHAGCGGDCALKLWFVYAGSRGSVRCTPVRHPLLVTSEILVAVDAQPTADAEAAYILDIYIENTSAIAAVDIVQVSTISPVWRSALQRETDSDQCIRRLFAAQTMELNIRCNASRTAVGRKDIVHFANAAILNALGEKQVLGQVPSTPSLELLHSIHHASPSQVDRSIMGPVLYHRWLAAKSQQRIMEQGGAIAVSPFPAVSELEVDLFIFWEIPEQERHGVLLITDTTLGAGHEHLAHTLSLLERPRISRAMYAETLSANRLATRSLHHSVWNHNADPVVIIPQVSAIFTHDFCEGPGTMPILFALKNYSITSCVRYVLRLSPHRDTLESASATCPDFIGSTRKTGRVDPLDVVLVKSHIWVEVPGSYTVAEWSLDIEVGNVEEGIWTATHQFNQSSDMRESVRFAAVHTPSSASTNP